MPDLLRIATRRSALARAQAEMVAGLLRLAHPGLETELVEVTTTGDLDRTSPVVALTEMGAFVRAVQKAVLDGRADLAVHSCKDLPVEGPAELVGFYPRREVPWDVLCGMSLHELPEGALVGTGSPRRAAQLLRIRPDLEVVPIRGNVGTRLAKAASGEVGAVLLAEAALRRIGRSGEISHRFSLAEMVPAPAQAALCLEAVVESEGALLAAALDDEDTRRAVETERLLLGQTHAGCRSALGALAVVSGGRISLTAFVADEHGARRGQAEAEEPADVVDLVREEIGL